MSPRAVLINGRISDSSCLIDLRKVSLLDAFLRLPYEVLIPNTLFEEELLRFTAVQKNALVKGGLKVVDLPGERVLRARQVVRKLPTIEVHDGFAFALAESHRGSSCLAVMPRCANWPLKTGSRCTGFVGSSTKFIGSR